jgi:hypothetical protein
VVWPTTNLEMYGPNAPAAASVPLLHSRWASGPATREDATRAPVAGSQIRIVPSAPAVASQVLSGGDRHRLPAAGVAGEGVAFLTGGRIPDPDRVVPAGGGQPGAVWGDRHRLPAAGVAGEGVAFLTGGRIPDPDRVVPSGPRRPCWRWRARLPSGAIATA